MVLGGNATTQSVFASEFSLPFSRPPLPPAADGVASALLQRSLLVSSCCLNWKPVSSDGVGVFVLYSMYVILGGMKR